MSRRSPEEAKRILEIMETDPSKLPEDVKKTFSKWRECIIHYIMYRRSRGYSEIQTRNQVYCLTRLAKILSAYNIGPEQLTFRDVTRMISVDRVRKKPLTISWLYENVLKQFYNVMVKSGLVNENPFQDLKMKVEKPLKTALNEEQLKKLLEAAYSLDPYKAAALKFIAYTGLRFSEFKTLRTADINLERRIMRVHSAKTGSIEYLPMLREAVEILSKHAIEDLNRYSKELLNRFIKKAAKKAELENWKTITLHTLRHTFITMILNKTGDPHLTKFLARHKSLQTTSQYLYMDLADAKRKLEEYKL